MPGSTGDGDVFGSQVIADDHVRPAQQPHQLAEPQVIEHRDSPLSTSTSQLPLLGKRLIDEHGDGRLPLILHDQVEKP